MRLKMQSELEATRMYLKGIKSLIDKLADNPLNDDPVLTMDIISQLIDKRVESIEKVLN